MRLVFWILGTLGVTCGIGLFVGAVFGKLGVSPAAGFTAGGFIVLAGVIHLVAGVKHYRGHWAFVTGTVLVTLGLSSLGALGGEEIPFQLFLAAAFTTFGLLSLWSGHKLHNCTLQLEQIAGAATVLQGGQATCAECGGIFKTRDMITHETWHVCARCKPIFLQKMAEGAKEVRSTPTPIS